LKSVEKERKIIRNLKLLGLNQLRILSHLLLDGQINQLLRNLLLPLRFPPINLGHQYTLNEILLLGNDGVDFLLTSEIILDDLLGYGEALVVEELEEVLLGQIDEDWFLFVGDYGEQFLYFLGEGLFLVLARLGQVRVEVELLLLLGVEEV
jgi:hypothetical protein